MWVLASAVRRLVITLCSTRSRRSLRSLRAGEGEQILDDLGRAVRFAVDQPQLTPERPHGSRPRVQRRTRHQQQFDVPEDALQRVVDFVCDPGDELTEGRKLLGLAEPRAKRLLVRFEPSLPRDIPRDEHFADRFVIFVDERGHGYHESAA